MTSYHSGDQLGAIVVDVGSANTKMGYAGDDYPGSYFRSNVAVSRDGPNPETGRISKINVDYYSRPILADGTDGDWDCANPIDMATGLMYDPNLGENGNIVKETSDWYDLFQKLVHHGFDTAFRGEVPKDHPIILAERSYNTPTLRQQMTECLFEELQVPAAFFSKDAVLSCYASGRTSGTVIDAGYSGTTVTPVFDGYVEAKGIRRNPAASLYQADHMILEILDKLSSGTTKQSNGALTMYQKLGFAERKPTIHKAARLHMANECRLHGAGASINTAPAGATTFHAPSVQFELPDGTVIHVPSVERFRVSDVVYGKETDAKDAYVAEIKTRVEKYINAASLFDDDDDSNQLKNESVGILEKNNRSSNKRKTKPRSVGAWQRACNPYLETLHDQLLTSAPVASMVCDAAYRCERDQQGTLLGNVILSGGGACVGPTDQAVPEAVKESVEALIHEHTPGWRVKVLTPGLSERAVLPWIGGSIVGSLGSFHDLWISKAEYEEWGSAIVNRKCP